MSQLIISIQDTNAVPDHLLLLAVVRADMSREAQTPKRSSKVIPDEYIHAPLLKRPPLGNHWEMAPTRHLRTPAIGLGLGIKPSAAVTVAIPTYSTNATVTESGVAACVMTRHCQRYTAISKKVASMQSSDTRILQKALICLEAPCLCLMERIQGSLQGAFFQECSPLGSLCPDVAASCRTCRLPASGRSASRASDGQVPANRPRQGPRKNHASR